MSLEGKWSLVIDMPFGRQILIAELTSANSGYVGTLANGAGAVPLTRARLSEDEATFEGTVQTAMGELHLAFYGILIEGQIFGKCQTAFGISNFSGRREAAALARRS